MRYSFKHLLFLLLFMIPGFYGCRSQPQPGADEIILLLAASNNGEIDPCG